MVVPLAELVEVWGRRADGLDFGKRVGSAFYVHADVLPSEIATALEEVGRRARISLGGYNVVKLQLSSRRLSLLHYPGFFDVAFPLLVDSWTVNIDSGEVERRSYRQDENPPVLHRKELLLPTNHPRRPEFEALTAEAEAHGLFRDASIIGHLLQWTEEMLACGVAVDGHRLVPLSQPSSYRTPEILRHRTALVRHSLSTPMQALWRHGFLTPATSVLDYGCGRGDDLTILQAQGISAEGWDPHFRPEGTRATADVVNLGFVLNVIENLHERREALRLAYGYARRVLAVAALIGGRTAFERFRLFRDGVLTSRGTFQKYFAHQELGAYLTEVLGREPVSVGPGLYFIFVADEEEQEFLERRQGSHVRPRLVDRTPPRSAAPPRPRNPRLPVERPARPLRPPKAPRPSRWDTNAELIGDFWGACLDLGRIPLHVEFQRLPALAAQVAPPSVVLRRLLEQHGECAFNDARQRRKEDLLVFLALNLLDRRRSAGSLSERIRHDVRSVWDSLSEADDEARELLFSLRAPDAVATACDLAAARGLGHLEPGEALQLDAQLVNELPVVLRVYIGCAGKLYGEAQDADVVKVHLHSGKVSLLSYDDYVGSAIPMLIERVKVDLRRQQVHYFQYGEEFPPQPLYFKSRYMNADCLGYAAQAAFDARLSTLSEFDWSGFGPPLSEVLEALDSLDPPDGLRITGPAAPPRP
jgi:DNA phosphorothioation-associated putative methyltransferase